MADDRSRPEVPEIPDGPRGPFVTDHGYLVDEVARAGVYWITDGGYQTGFVVGGDSPPGSSRRSSASRPVRLCRRSPEQVQPLFELHADLARQLV